ncbi:MAG: choice-of-anchor O protein [bacterium]|nr:choice-of-anchor O protein [bacterium]
MRNLNSTRFKYTVLGAAVVAGVAYAATQIIVQPSITLSAGTSGDKPKIQRMGDGRLVALYGDNTPGAGTVYDVKADIERTARDAYAKSCLPSSTVTCNNPADWSAPVNLSNSALQSSIQTAWKASDNTRYTYPGDIDKVNIKSTGSAVVATWVSKYCPDGDTSTLGVVDGTSQQRAIKYLERAGRTIPFSCTWVARSTNNGVSWSPAVQLSTGLRDAIQDSSSGNFNSTTKTGQVNISWQEDPQGLKLGEADGPGDGASGANVNGGTDVWYTSATMDLSVPSTPANDFVLATPVRITDNFAGDYGISGGTLNIIYDGTGANVDPATLEKGQAGAARPNIGMVGSTSIIAYEETKGAGGLDEGKFIRYHAFPFNTPPATATEKAGCIISNPAKNARRVRFLTQSPTDAGAGGIQMGIFWKEGIVNGGGPSDIVLRRGIDGLQPANLVPAVDSANCATSDYATASTLSNTPGDNVSSRTPTATSANLLDDTEANDTENALAHRGVLRGRDMWIGYSYTSNLSNLWSQTDNYNFWLRKFNVDTGAWSRPTNVTRITDKNINVREPRIFGTPKSSETKCPTGIPADVTTTDPTFCQNTDIIYVGWGTETNVSPFDPAGPQNLGEYITGSTDAAENFQLPVKLSEAQGVMVWGIEESAFESQIVARPDGRRFYGVWNQQNLLTGDTYAQYTSGDMSGESEPQPVPRSNITMSSEGGAFPVIGITLLGLLGLLRRRQGR